MTGVQASSGKNRNCNYTVKCSEWFPYEKKFESNDFDDTDTWFRADPYLRWYWCGTTCYVVANIEERELLIIDAYVSKATIGGNRDFGSAKPARRRILRWLNLLRGFIADGFKVVGILTSHDHGDHIGDLPYLLGGLRAKPTTDYMGTGAALIGAAQPGRIPIVMSHESFSDPYYHRKIGGNAYRRPQSGEVEFPVFQNAQTKIFGRPFSEGATMHYGSFDVTPYIWYHGRLADGLHDERRTLAYLIRRTGPSDQNSKTFITTGFCERPEYVNQINKQIHCHHLIFAYSGGEPAAESAKKIVLLPNSPAGYNFIFSGHTDNNNSHAFDAADDRAKVSGLMNQFLLNGLVRVENGKTTWHDAELPIRLGYWGNRLADG